MRVGMVVFANKWTGAGAVADLNCRALHSHGVDAKLLFVGGRNLERRLQENPWANPILIKERSPLDFRSNLRSIARLAGDCDVVICHLPHDHLLCVAAGAHRRATLVRAFRNPRHIRRDPYHRYLDRRLIGAVCANSILEGDLRRSQPSQSTIALPVPLDDRFKPTEGLSWRERLGLPFGAHVIGSIGKLAEGRGFRRLLDAAARLKEPAHVLVIGHGELQPQLERHAADLGLGQRVRWTGYQDEALPGLYSVMDTVLFLSPGSDWGHRMISEAQGCGRPVIAVSHSGVEDLVEDGITGRIVNREPAALSSAVDSLIADPETAHRLGKAAAFTVEGRRLEPIGRSLARFLEAVLSRKQLH